MKGGLSLSKVKEYLEKAEFSFRHEECESCECYLGYIAQLQIDSGPEANEYLKRYKLARDEIHSCLGCDPCPPGILFTNYLRNKNNR